MVHGLNLSLEGDLLTTLYIKNGKDLDDNPIEVLVEGNKIKAIATHLDVSADKVLDLKNKSYVSAGWIDDHTHCYEKLSLYYDDPDKIGYTTGVITVIDAGSTGADNIGDFYQITRNKKTNVLAMINISRTGILAQDELGDMTKIQFEPFQEAVSKYPDFIVGMKARISKSVVAGNGIKPLIKAKEFQSQLSRNLPLMVHVGTNPPTLSEIMSIMDKGDIMTHCFNGKTNGILNSDDSLKEFVKEGLAKGIIFDIGHGTDSYNFHTAEVATAEKVVPQSLSTDIYHSNREHGPVYNMATCIEKLMLLGYSLRDVIKMITENPAHNYHLTSKGQLKSGKDADITVFNIEKGTKQLTDSNGNKLKTENLIKPTYSIVGGQLYSIGD